MAEHATTTHVGAPEHHPEPTAFGLDAPQWIALAMVVVFAILLWKRVPRIIAAALDNKIAGIRAQLDEAAQLRAEAEALKAEPYDIDDVTFSHRGPQCSFDAFLAEFDLHDPVLDRLADVVRAADTGELAQSPQAPGLLAISLGLSATIADDTLLLEQAMTMYDALYAWCKIAHAETHSWPKKKS